MIARNGNDTLLRIASVIPQKDLSWVENGMLFSLEFVNYDLDVYGKIINEIITDEKYIFSVGVGTKQLCPVESPIQIGISTEAIAISLRSNPERQIVIEPVIDITNIRRCGPFTKIELTVDLKLLVQDILTTFTLL